jgi:hypothetical protein
LAVQGPQILRHSVIAIQFLSDSRSSMLWNIVFLRLSRRNGVAGGERLLERLIEFIVDVTFDFLVRRSLRWGVHKVAPQSIC